MSKTFSTLSTEQDLTKFSTFQVLLSKETAKNLKKFLSDQCSPYLAHSQYLSGKLWKTFLNFYPKFYNCFLLNVATRDHLCSVAC